MLRFLANAGLLLTIANLAHAQGNEGAVVMSREYVRSLRQSLPDDRDSIAVDTYKRTRETMPTAKVGAVAADANLAMLGAASIKPGVMTKVRFQRRDYLSLSAQLLFGESTTEEDPSDISGNLFVPEASQYAINLLAYWTPQSKGQITKELAVNGGFYYALKQVPVVEPMATEPLLLDIGVLHAHLGPEYFVVPGQFSIYANVHVLSVQQDVANYRRAFGTDVEQTFWYWAPGLRAKFNDTLFLDLEFVVLNNDMKTLRQSDDGVLPLLRLGFGQTLTQF